MGEIIDNVIRDGIVKIVQTNVENKLYSPLMDFSNKLRDALGQHNIVV